jgi:hypothetical protein
VPTVMTKVFLLNLLGSEILCEISQEPHKSMTLKCGCVTSQRFFCSACQLALREKLTLVMDIDCLW